MDPADADRHQLADLAGGRPARSWARQSWRSLDGGPLCPPDMGESGVDLDALIVVQVPLKRSTSNRPPLLALSYVLRTCTNRATNSTRSAGLISIGLCERLALIGSSVFFAPARRQRLNGSGAPRVSGGDRCAETSWRGAGDGAPAGSSSAPLGVTGPRSSGSDSLSRPILRSRADVGSVMRLFERMTAVLAQLHSHRALASETHEVTGGVSHDTLSQLCAHLRSPTLEVEMPDLTTRHPVQVPVVNPDGSALPRRLSMLWLELSQRCNLQCVHCYSDSGPKMSARGRMADRDWMNLLIESRRAGCEVVQFIGGEPTLHPAFKELVSAAHALQFRVIEVFTNATLVTAKTCEFLRSLNASVAVSFYSTDAAKHRAITRVEGSFERTVRGIKNLVATGVPIRVEVIGGDAAGFKASQAFLHALGVSQISGDRFRAVGRGNGITPAPQDHDLCGQCWRGKLCVTSTGNAYPCIMARAVPVGNFLEKGIVGLLASTPLLDFRSTMQATEEAKRDRRRAGCGPDNEGECGPDNKGECGPDNGLCGPDKLGIPCGPDKDIVCGPDNQADCGPDFGGVCGPDNPCGPDNN